MNNQPYLEHLRSEEQLVTSYAARRAGFVALALEKNRKATPYVQEAKALYVAASKATTPTDLLRIPDIQAGLLTAAGLSDKALNHLQPEDKLEAVQGLIKNFLEPAGDKFIEELIYRFLLIRGDTLGGSMRNVGGVLAQRKLTRALIASLNISGLSYRWLEHRSKRWYDKTQDDVDVEFSARGLAWSHSQGQRTLIYNLTIPFIRNNVDLCLFNDNPAQIMMTEYRHPDTYLALGELKGGIDPAGADEHWKTARTALDRIRTGFKDVNLKPHTFFVGAAIERKMAGEIWAQLQVGLLSNAANLNEYDQVASISRWLCRL
ncbi:AvaI/BsoBI family type II restriction endonuclease [Candidatus Viridilinea mediisalina]|uniref:Restriction endonuclease n=1 Tax=Candidatus Viridilinea mediisalina TaxID=2024553 RepID=A0A2A6RMY7_9CHLR|nr:AvaI/BsoBI family type II restriction endonuclease [Candidatus Viridilinea mediisalina]PDW04407.1 restriction endonuclease [Candidatus Viridilinea mediisalina]